MTNSIKHQHFLIRELYSIYFNKNLRERMAPGVFRQIRIAMDQAKPGDDILRDALMAYLNAATLL